MIFTCGPFVFVQVICLFCSTIWWTLLCNKSLMTSAFNLDVRSAVIKPGPKKTYFGYSVALFRFNRERHLIIGAPLANGSMDVLDAGAIYKCNIERQSGCARIDLDKRGEEFLNGTKTESKQHQWLGATIATSKNGVLLTCAPRYVHFSENLRRKEPVGLCYLSTLSMHTDSFEYSPCRQPESWGYHRIGSCQAGFAATISRDGRHFLLTAPGSHYWQGQVYSYSRNDTSYMPSFSQERDASEDDTYLGYSVVYGDFSSNHMGLEFAVGIPKAFHNLTGKVSIMDAKFNIIWEVIGEQTGAYFGYAVTSLDMNGDARTDLVVSAPLHSVYDQPYDFWEVGRVYVYVQTNRSEFILHTMLDGDTCRGRFGVSLTNLGDINRDSYEDLAVGAPYAGPNNNGLVYIYNGGPTGLQRVASQVLAPEQLPFNGPVLRTFGWSLASGVDLNNDDYPDLLIGSYASDAVVFLRSRPLIDTRVKFEVQPANVSLEHQTCSKIDGTQVPCVTITVCLAFNGHRSVANKLRFLWNVRLDVDNKRTFPRMYVVNMNNDRMHMQRGVLALERGRLGQCNKFKAYIEQHVLDFHNPIVLQLDYVIQNYHSLASGSRLHTPMLNRASDKSIRTQVRIQHDCGLDNVCVPDLKVDVTKNMESYTLNGPANLLLNVCVCNDGEYAYNAYVTIDIPEDLSLVRLHQNNSVLTWHEYHVEISGRNKVQVSLGDPMAALSKICFQLEFNTRQHLRTTYSDLTFILKAYSSNQEPEVTLNDNELVIGIPVRLNIQLQPFGQSFVNNQPEEYVCEADEMDAVYSSALTVRSRNTIFPDAQPTIRHVYYLRNQGPSALHQANLTIFWPERTIEQRPLFELIAQPKIRVINQPEKMLHGNAVNASNGSSKMLHRWPVSVQCQHIDLNAIVDQNNELNGLPEINSDYVESDWINLKMMRSKRSLEDRPADAKIYFDCDSSRCRKVECWISDMAANTEVIIEMIARPWNQTLKEVQISHYFVTSVAVLHLPLHISHQLTSQIALPLVIRVSTLIRLIGPRFDDVISLHSILIAICSGISLLTFIIFVLERMDFFKSNRKCMGKQSVCQQLLTSPSDSLLDRTILNKSLPITSCSSDYSPLECHSSSGGPFDESCNLVRNVFDHHNHHHHKAHQHHHQHHHHHDCHDDEHEPHHHAHDSDCEFGAQMAANQSFDQISAISSQQCFESSFDNLSDCEMTDNDLDQCHHQCHPHHKHDHDDHNDYCDLHERSRSRLSARHLCREKLYDKLHYSRNHSAYHFYRDLSQHEPHCPFYASRRSLVSYK